MLVSNAALQWVPGHRELLRRWAAELPAGAWLAMQVPGNFAADSHRALREVANRPTWRADVAPLLRADPVDDPADYAALLTAAGCAVDAWETTYVHLLPARPAAAHPVLAWMEGTALRPVRAALDAAGWSAFRAELGVRLTAAYPVRQGQVYFPFRRVFVVARTGDHAQENLVTDLPTFIAGLPKVELHVHHVGSASPRIVAELAARHEGRTPVPADPDALADYFEFRDFAHFIEVYLSVVDLIRDPEDVWILTHEVARELARQQVRYAELTITPYSHVRRGIPAPAFCEAIEDARKRALADFGIELRWCFDIPGEAGLPAAEETLRIALDERPDGLVSFGLGGPEIGVPRPQFRPYFDQARAAGLRSVPHAGETTGPQTVWDALNELGAERIGHGISAAQDPQLLAYLAERQIGMEVCPTSNVRTRAVATLDEHPLPRLVEAGLLVTINSDDPPMFGTTLNDEYAVAARLLGVGAEGLAGLARNAVTASFLDPAGQQRIIAEIDAYLAAAG